MGNMLVDPDRHLTNGD